MSGLGLEACAGFGTAAIRVSEEAKSGGGQCGRLRPPKHPVARRVRGWGWGSAPAPPLTASTILGKHLPSLAPVSCILRGFAKYSQRVLSSLDISVASLTCLPSGDRPRRQSRSISQLRENPPSDGQHMVLSALEGLIGELFHFGVRIQTYLPNPRPIFQNVYTVCGEQ